MLFFHCLFKFHYSWSNFGLLRKTHCANLMYSRREVNSLSLDHFLRLIVFIEDPESMNVIQKTESTYFGGLKMSSGFSIISNHSVKNHNVSVNVLSYLL